MAARADRRSRWRAVRGCIGLVALACCGSRATPVRGDGGADRARSNVVIVARVGSATVTGDDVAATARAEGIGDAHTALTRAIENELLAQEARRRGLDADPLIADTARRAAVQSLLAATVETTVRPDNLPADEIARGVRALGFDLSHGELWRAQHALVKVDEDADARTRAAARAMAEEIRRRTLALALPRDGDPFRSIAETVAHRVRHEVADLPPIDTEGHSAHNDFVPAFVHALIALRQPGDVSPVVETPFGYHVIVLQERIPPVDHPLDAVRARVREELLVGLRHTELEHLLVALRAEYNIRVREDVVREAERMRLVGESP